MCARISATASGPVAGQMLSRYLFAEHDPRFSQAQAYLDTPKLSHPSVRAML